MSQIINTLLLKVFNLFKTWDRKTLIAEERKRLAKKSLIKNGLLKEDWDSIKGILEKS